MIVHLIDVHPLPGAPSPVEAYRMIRNELQAYSQELAAKPELIVANKIDLADNLDAVDELRAELDGLPIRAISGVTGAGLPGLGERLWDMIQQAKEDEARNKASRPVEDPFAPPPFDREPAPFDDEADEDGEDELEPTNPPTASTMSSRTMEPNHDCRTRRSPRCDHPHEHEHTAGRHEAAQHLILASIGNTRISMASWSEGQRGGSTSLHR